MSKKSVKSNNSLLESNEAETSKENAEITSSGTFFHLEACEPDELIECADELWINDYCLEEMTEEGRKVLGEMSADEMEAELFSIIDVEHSIQDVGMSVRLLLVNLRQGLSL